MADTLPDVSLVSSVWNDLYTLTNIEIGKSLILKNKSPNPIVVVIAANTPPTNFAGGWDLAASDWVIAKSVTPGSRVWAKGSGKLMVQVDE